MADEIENEFGSDVVAQYPLKTIKKRVDEIGHSFGELEDCGDYEIDVKSHDIGWWQCYQAIKEMLENI